MNQDQEIRAITGRISKTEMARALIEAGKFDKALEMLSDILPGLKPGASKNIYGLRP